MNGEQRNESVPDSTPQPVTKRRGIEQPRPKVSMLEIMFWAFLLVAVGRLGELIPGMSAIPAAKITLALALILLVAQWKRLSRVGDAARSLVKTAGWMFVIAILLTPFSYWRGASIAFLMNELPVLFVVTVVSFKIANNWNVVRGTMLTLVVAGLLLTRAALANYTGGRAAANTMYDTNDLAYFLVTIFPLSLGFALSAKTTFKRLMHGGFALAFLVGMLLTSSRGAFLALVAVSVLMVLLPIKEPVAVIEGRGRGKAKKKGTSFMLPLLGAVVAGAIIWPQLPLETRERFSTLLALKDDYNLDQTNEKSRGRIWERGTQAAMDRPVGYGPRAFMMVDLMRGGKMMTAHNSFLQSAVELGLIGLILFCRMYTLSWRGLTRARSQVLSQDVALDPDRQEKIIMCRMLQFSLIGNAIAGFFLTMAYSTLLWVTFGLCIACINLLGPAEVATRGRGKARARRVAVSPT